MFAIFNRENLPTINVSFTGNNITDELFQNFLQEWNNCDEMKVPYSYYFDTTTGMGNPKLKYAFGMAAFIKKKKKEKEKYLQHSIIYVTSRRTYLLLRMIFNLSSPIAPVYIVQENTPEFNESLNSALINNTKLPPNILKFVP